MRIDFSPRLERSWVAVAVGGAALIGGIIKTSSANHKAKQAEQKLENLKTPEYQQNQSILDYYNKAMQRYQQNQYQSNLYQHGIQQGDRSTAAGLNALQDRNSAVGGVSRLTALQNENALNTGLRAEDVERNNFGQLGAATQLRSSDQEYQFGVNKLFPYQTKANMYAAKAAGATQVANAGWQDISNGAGMIAGGAADYYGNRNIYSGGQSGGGSDINTNANWNDYQMPIGTGIK